VLAQRAALAGLAAFARLSVVALLARLPVPEPPVVAVEAIARRQSSSNPQLD